MADNGLNLDGRIAFVTGASSRGIGAGIAKKLAEHGAKVFLVARREENLQEQVATIEAAGGEAAYAVVDVTSEEQVKDAVDACAEHFGGIDILIAAAGYCGMYSEGVEFDSEDWHEVLDINLSGVYYAVQHAYPYLKESEHAVVIPLLSMASLKVAGFLPYTATKGALLRMVPWWAKFMGPDGIRVNGIAPGTVDTDMTNPPGWDTTEMVFVPQAEKNPLGFCATIGDCADAALFLVSDMARSITGQVLAVDGGEALVD